MALVCLQIIIIQRKCTAKQSKWPRGKDFVFDIIINGVMIISVCEDVAASRATRSQSVSSLVSEGLATAYFIYAQCLFLGQGVNKDVEKAKTEYTKVLHWIFNLFLMYFSGNSD